MFFAQRGGIAVRPSRLIRPSDSCFRASPDGFFHVRKYKIYKIFMPS